MICLQPRDRDALRPDWLSVPAAQHDCASAPGCVGDVGDQHRQSRSRVAVPQPALKSRILLVSVDACRDEGVDAGLEMGAGRLTAAEPCPPCSLLHCHRAEPTAQPDRRVAADVERVWLRGPAPSRSSTITAAMNPSITTTVNPALCRWPKDDPGTCCCSPRMDKHRLDLTLSAGRHAAERAKLAGIGHLLASAPRLDAGVPLVSPDHGCRVMNDGFCVDPYSQLRCAGHPEIAALVGVAIAGAQMGLSVHLPGPLGEVVARAALRLNPGIRGWLDVSRAEPSARPRPIRILATADP